MSDVEQARREYAEAIAKKVKPRSESLLRAFATVPRERYLGPGPWLVFEGVQGYGSTPDANPARIYQDIPVALDPRRSLNSGQPSLLALEIDALDVAPGARVLHVGCGPGYYTAILAELVGREGRVTAIELDPELAERAQRNLADYPQVTTLRGDGTRHDPEPADAILVSAGATHPRVAWLDALRPAGRMVLPLTATRPLSQIARFVRNNAGRVLRVERCASGYRASFIERLGIAPLIGGRNPAYQRELQALLDQGGFDAVRSLRREAHERDASCWFHGGDFCLSRRALPEGE